MAESISTARARASRLRKKLDAANERIRQLWDVLKKDADWHHSMGINAGAPNYHGNDARRKYKILGERP